jgi:retron-type reverse transcriptase
MSLELGFNYIARHRGNHADFGRRYQLAATEAVAISGPARRAFFANLLAYTADFRFLRIATDHLRSNGGKSPGMDGVRLEHLAQTDIWDMLQTLEAELMSGQYRRGPLKRCRVQKHFRSTEKRTIHVPNLRDRIVMRAAAQSLAPIIGSVVDPLAFCWPKRGVRLALAHARRFLLDQERPLWIVEDIRGAFDHVPRQRLANILGRLTPCPRFCRLVMELVGPPTSRGILQGAAISGQLLELYLAHFLHRPWRRMRGGPPPMARYVDDICVPCQSTAEADLYYDRLCELLQSAGFQAKHGHDRAVVDLRFQSATWLGYRLRLRQGQLQIRSRHFGDEFDDPESDSRKLLFEKFSRLHEFPDSWQRPNRVVCGLVQHLAPASPCVSPRAIYRQIRGVAQDAGFDEILGYEEFYCRWQNAHANWEEKCAQVARGSLQFN